LGAGGGAAEEVEESQGEETTDEPGAGSFGQEIARIFARRLVAVGIQWLQVRSSHLSLGTSHCAKLTSTSKVVAAY